MDRTVATTRASAARIPAAATLAVVVGMMPAFMLGATAVLVRADLAFSQARLGVAAGAFFAALAVTSLPSGTLADRIGPRPALLSALATSAVATAGIALLTPSWGWLVAWMLVAGAAGGLMMSAASLAVVRGAGARGGIVFGVQQSAIPFTSLLGGLAVPSVALTLGWRWTFGLGLLLVPVVALLVPPTNRFTVDAGSGGPLVPRVRLPKGFILLVLAMALASAAAITTSAFLVESAVERGTSTAAAALVLSAASVVCITTRLFVGWRADRRTGGHLAVVAMMVALAAVGHLTLAMAGSLPVIAVGGLLAFGVGYGWPGLLFHGVAVIHPQGVGAAIGAANAGGAVGAAAGPALFGLLATGVSHRAAWLMVAGLAVAGSMAIYGSAARLEPGAGRAIVHDDRGCR